MNQTTDSSNRSPRPWRRHAVRLLAPAGAVIAAVTLAACGGSSHSSKVASLSGSGAGGSHHASSSVGAGGVPDPDGRPRLALDATTSQEFKLTGPYFACLRAHRYVDQQSASARLAVNAKCEHLEPLAPWQLDPANPQARAFIGRTVSCLEAKGYHAQAELVTNVPIQAPEWFVRYSPKALNYTPRRPVAAESACNRKAES